MSETDEDVCNGCSARNDSTWCALAECSVKNSRKHKELEAIADELAAALSDSKEMFRAYIREAGIPDRKESGALLNKWTAALAKHNNRKAYARHEGGRVMDCNGYCLSCNKIEELEAQAAAMREKMAQLLAYVDERREDGNREGEKFHEGVIKAMAALTGARPPEETEDA